MLNDRITECIVKNNVKIITSIYSNIPEIHDIITRKKESFDITVSNIKNLKVYVKANTTILKYNINNINDISEFTYKLTGIHGKFDVIRDIGISKKYLIPGTLNKALGKIRTKAKFRGINRYLE